MKSSDLTRSPGRPKTIKGEGSLVSAWLPAQVHDALITAANKRDDQSVSALVRETLQAAFPINK